MTVNVISNEDIVLFLIKKATEFDGVDTKGILGKKALQKSLYFFNLGFNIFSFKWGDYGPISGEIQQIIEDLITSGNVKVTEIPTKKEGAVIKKLQFSEEANPRFSEIKFPSHIENRLDETIEFTAGKSPRDLELLASVHYWAKKEQFAVDKYSKEYVFEKLTQLKPDAGFNQKDVEFAIKILEKHGYLRYY